MHCVPRDLAHPRLESHLDPHPAETREGIGAQTVRQSCEQPVFSLHQDDADLRKIHAWKILHKRSPNQLGQGASKLHPRGAAPHDREREQPPASLGIRFDCCPLEATQGARPQHGSLLQGLQRKGVVYCAWQPEVVGDTSGGQDQEVVGNCGAVGFQDPLGQVHPLHIRQDEPDVGEAPQNAPDRVCNLLRLQLGRRHLIKQGQEAVVIVTVDQRHLNRMARQIPGGPQSAKPGSHDYHPRSTLRCHHAWTAVQGMWIPGTCHNGVRHVSGSSGMIQVMQVSVSIRSRTSPSAADPWPLKNAAPLFQWD